MHLALSVVVAGIAVGAYYCLVTLALQMTYSGTRVLNFAQGDMAAAGGLGFWWLTSQEHLNDWLALGLVIVAGFVAGTIVCGLLTPFFKRSEIQAGVATIAISFAIQGLLQRSLGATTEVPNPLLSGNAWHWGSVVVVREDAVLVVGAIIVVGLLYALFRFTTVGLLIRASAASIEGARVSGVNEHVVRLIVFGVSGAISAAAGAMISPIIGASYAEGVDVLLIAFVAAALGGLGSVATATIGALGLSIVKQGVAVSSAGQYQNVALFLLLAAVLIVRPQGLGQRTVTVRR
jgi:branched-chain amino acid transport system permease protein